MSAQPEHHTATVRAIPRTIDAIGKALTAEARTAFATEVLGADETQVVAVMRRWWLRAMLDAAPGADGSRANVDSGLHVIPLDELLARAAG